MGLMKKIKTAKEQDCSLKFAIYPIEIARAMRNYIRNPPIRLPHYYNGDYMNLPLDNAGDSPIESAVGENYIVVDTTTHAQKIVFVFKDMNNHQVVLPSGEKSYQYLEQFNYPSFRWLRIRPITKSDVINLRRQPCN